MPNSYALTQRLKNMMKARGLRMVCAFCNQPLEPGDNVISRAAGKNKTTRYHKKCFEQMWIAY